MKKSFHFLCLPLVILLAGCNSPTCPDQWQVSGTLADYPNAVVYVDVVNPTGFKVLDSTTTNAEGAFEFKPVCNGADAKTPTDLYTIRLHNNQSILFDPQRDHLTLTANAGQLSAGKITGNAATASLQEFNKRRNMLRAEFGMRNRALSMVSRENDPAGWQAHEAAADIAMNNYREYVRGYADTVPYPELAWYAVSNLHTEGDFYYIQRFVERRKTAGESSPYLTHLENAILKHGASFLRFEAEDFKSADVHGDSISLSSRRGKVTYLYIWASYCGLSRMETQRLAAWRKAHPEVPIEILTFSIDDDPDAWRKAVNEDSLNWPGQVLGQMSWSSPEIRQFGVQSIPVSFVLDARGIIRSKNANAMDLEQDYAEMVKKWGSVDSVAD